MRCLAFAVCLWISNEACAGDQRLLPVFTPQPEYPAQLIQSRHAGKVRLQLTVEPGGTVQSATVRESSHPQFSDAARRTVLQWRFTPWDVQGGKPPNVEFVVLILFGARGVEPFSSGITVGLNNTLCAYLNHEIMASKHDFPDAPLSNVDVFSYTAEFLRSEYVALLVPDPAERKTLLRVLNRAIPRVITRCRRAPESQYADQLPKKIRELFVDIETSKRDSQ